MSARLWFLSIIGWLTLPLGSEIRSDNTIRNPDDGREYFDYVMQQQFPAPDGHWTPVGSWKCILYNANDVEQDSHDYTIKVPPPPGG